MSKTTSNWNMRRCGRFMVATALALGLPWSLSAGIVFETKDDATDEAKVFVFGTPVNEGEIQTSNIGSAESCVDGRIAFRAGTVNVRAGGYVHVNGKDTGNYVETGNWIGANARVATLNIDGGTFWVDVRGATNNGRGLLRVPVGGGANTATLNLNSGLLRVDNVLYVGGVQWNTAYACAKNGEVNIRGGTAKIATLNLGTISTKATGTSGGFAQATLNLTGGILEVAKFNFNAGHSQSFTWDAGTVKATDANVFSEVALASGCTRTVNVTGNPAVFDTGNFAQTVPAAIANGTGTLKLTGGNTVTLSAAPSFGVWLDDGTTLVPADGSLAVPASGTFMFSGDATVDGSLALASGARIVCHVDDFLQSTAGTLTVTGGFILPEGVESVLDLVTVPGGAAVYEKSLSADGKTITVSKSGGSDFTWNGGVSANWDDQDVWVSDGTAANWVDGGRALFATPGAAVTLGGSDVSAASVSFDADTVINGTSSLAAPVVHVASGVSATVGAQTSGALEKIGAGTLTLGSSRTDATTLTEGTLVMGSGTSLDWSNFIFGTDATKPVTLCLESTATLANIPNSGTWTIGSVENVSSTVYKKGGSWTMTEGTLVAIGSGAGARVAFYHEGGTWTGLSKGYFAIGSGASAENHADSVYFEISGGSVKNASTYGHRTIIGDYGEATVVVTNSGSLVVSNSGSSLAIGKNTGSVGNLKVVGGGKVTIAGAIWFGDEGGSGTLEVSDGGVVDVGGQVIVSAKSKTASSVISLKSGGVFSTHSIYRENGSKMATLNFDGGTFRKSKADGNVFPANGTNLRIDVAIGANGGTMDNNGLSITIPRTITGTGGLRLTGSGKTTISASQSYAGATTVASNTTLSVTNGCTFAGTVCLENGSTLDIASYEAGAVPFTAATLALPADGKAALTLNGGDFPLGTYTICSASGVTAAGVKDALVPAVASGHARWKVADGKLVLSVVPDGMAIIFR